MYIPSLILAMSLSGSIIVILYLLTYPLAKRYFPIKWRYLVLKLAVAFYLIPFPYYFCKFVAFNRMRSMNPVVRALFPGPQIERSIISFTKFGAIIFSEELKKKMFFTFLLLLAALCSVWFHLFRYWRVRKRCLEDVEEAKAEKREEFHQIKKELGLKQQVRLVYSDYCKSPIVIGILSPVVVFPSKKAICSDSDEYMMKHELLHVRNRDLLVKFLGFAALAVHWFNPLCHFLFYEIVNISEMCCDSDVIKGEGEKARKEYGRLLIELATEKNPENNSFFFSGLLHGSGKKVMKRRILEMRQNRKNHCLLSGLMMICISLTGVFTGFAYGGPGVAISMETEPEINKTEIFLETVRHLWLGSECRYTAYVPEDYDWIDKNGECRSIEYLEEITRLCEHEFCLNGTLYRRDEVDFREIEEGMVYEALQCSKCGYVSRGHEIIVIPSDHYWVEEDGTIVDKKYASSTSNLCNHNFICEGKGYEHQEDGKGGCKTVIYEGLRCSICGQIKDGEEQNAVIYSECIHRYQNNNVIK